MITIWIDAQISSAIATWINENYSLYFKHNSDFSRKCRIIQKIIER